MQVTSSTLPICYSSIRLAPSRSERSCGLPTPLPISSSSLTRSNRYTLTYTPSADRILPAPKFLHVKVKNTSAVPLRAAYLHGPYTLYVASYPSTFDPNQKHETSKQEGAPDYEPNLKAGGHWSSKLTVPQEIREAAGGPLSRQSSDGNPRSFTWIIEVASQILFSTTAAVHFDVLVGRDERSVDLGFHAGVGLAQGAPGRLEDHQQGRSRNAAHAKGVYSKAVRLAVDDTESLWNTPPFPQWDEDGNATIKIGPHHGDKRDAEAKGDQKSRQQKKVHLVVLTHGLHSNLGADMLYVKESIDTAAKQAREDSRKRRAELRNDQLRKTAQSTPGVDARPASAPEEAIAPTKSLQEDSGDDDEEQVIVRGFRGNAVKTERGIQYLGKRLAKYVLSVTYPDQPYLPVKSSISKTIARSFTGSKSSDGQTQPTHKNSSIVKDEQHTNHNLAYRITSISFIGHSLGGNIQTYAIAYIQKHSPDFFERIAPINFVAMASPFLGLSNENPMYVKFALDFGLVGRTGQDLGLTWRAPTLARSGWGAVIGGFGGEAQKTSRQPNPTTKPLLRVLPTGPAHFALKKFRNRSVYSNVVNDGIVPLRTSCLLFLDWRGLGRVEKARRENGLVGTMVGWGWAEMTGQNASSPRRSRLGNDAFNDSGDDSDVKQNESTRHRGDDVPQADVGEGLDEENITSPEKSRLSNGSLFQDEGSDPNKGKETSAQQLPGAWAGLMSFFKPHASPKAHHHPHKHQKIYERGQIKRDSTDRESEQSGTGDEDSVGGSAQSGRKALVRGSSLYTNNSQNGDLEAPPKTTFFESAGDVLNPPLPPKEFLIDPEARPRTIFHDRIYHPEDIPPPPTKRQRSLIKRSTSQEAVSKGGQNNTSTANNDFASSPNLGAMKIEEKIARAYHKDLSWRKVLVRLEPDAHNNMIVRRMFANAYGWPVVKHLCDTHFAYTLAAEMPDSEEVNKERAEPASVRAGKEGEEVQGQTDKPPEVETLQKSEGHQRAKSLSPHRGEDESDDDVSEPLKKLDLKPLAPPRRTDSEIRESSDQVHELVSPVTANTGESSRSSTWSKTPSSVSSKLSRQDSAKWSDRFFEGSEDDSDEDEDNESNEPARRNRETEKGRTKKSKSVVRGDNKTNKGENDASVEEEEPEIADFLTQSPNQSAIDLPATGEPNKLTHTQSNLADGFPDHATLASMGTGLGLRKSLEEQITPVEERKKGQVSLGVAEQVAFASAKKGERE